MKNIVFKTAITASLMLIMAAFTLNAQAKETIESNIVQEANGANVKSKIFINNGQVEFKAGIPLGNTGNANYELKDNKGNVVSSGSLEPAKVISFSAENLDKGGYEFIVDGKVMEKFIIN